MLKNKILTVVSLIFCTLLLGTNIVSAQAVTDNSRDKKMDAALNATVTPQAEQQASAPVSMKAQEPAAAQPLPAVAPSPKIVKAIEIHGNKSIGIAQILARIKTRVGEGYQESVVSDDLKRLYNTGHFALEEYHQEIADNIRTFLTSKK